MQIVPNNTPPSSKIFYFHPNSNLDMTFLLILFVRNNLCITNFSLKFIGASELEVKGMSYFLFNTTKIIKYLSSKITKKEKIINRID